MANWYIDYGNGTNTGHWAVAQWAASHVYAAGSIVRQLAAPTLGGERCFRTATGGTSGGSEPTWDLLPGSTQPTDGTITDWVEITGREAYQSSGNWAAPFARLGSAYANSYSTVASVSNGGTSGTYAVNDVLTLTGGTTYGPAAQFRVTAVSAGKVTAATRINGGSYQTAPTAQTTSGGGGSGCTLNINTVGVGTAGDKYFINSTSNELQSTALNIGVRGTFAAPDYILCVTSSGSVPPVSADLRTGATIGTTGSGTTFNFNQNGGAAYWCQGVNFQVGSGSNSSNISINPSGATSYFKNCTFTQAGSSATFSTQFNGGSSNLGAKLTLDNCSVSVANASNNLQFNGGISVLWKNTATPVTSATVPTNLLLYAGGARAAVITLDGVDLSIFGSGKTLFNAIGSAYSVNLVNCKLNASVTVAATPQTPGARVNVQMSDSGATGYRQEIYDYAGTLTTETTKIRTGGANDGVQALSWKIVTNANSNLIDPFETYPLAIWNSTTGSSKTLTIPIMNDGTTLTNADVWVEVQYLGSSSQPISSFVSSGLADVLASSSNITTDSTSSWITTGITTPVKQQLQVSFTPQMAGYVRAVIKIAKTSKTIYIDPKAVIT